LIVNIRGELVIASIELPVVVLELAGSVLAPEQVNGLFRESRGSVPFARCRFSKGRDPFLRFFSEPFPPRG
jgi:hypothetical protein